MPKHLFLSPPAGIAALCALALCAAPLASQAGTQGLNPSGYKLAATWKPGGEGHWDYMTVDPAAGRLYIARENRIQILDTTTGALVGEVPGINGAHGVALVPALHRGFASSGRDGKVIVFDLGTLKPAGDPIPVGRKPDAITYDPKTKCVFAMDGGSHEISVINPAAAKVTGTIPLPGTPEFAVPDGAGKLYVNIVDKSEVAEIDAKAMKLEKVWPLSPGTNPTGLAIDTAGHHLFAGCGNNTMIVLDYTTGVVDAALPIGSHVDATAFDPLLTGPHPALAPAPAPNGKDQAAILEGPVGYALSSNGDGTLTVATPDSSGAYKVLDTVATKAGARTMAVDPKTHAVYLCTADFGPGDATSHGRPKPLPGSFMVMKFTR